MRRKANLSSLRHPELANRRIRDREGEIAPVRLGSLGLQGQDEVDRRGAAVGLEREAAIGVVAGPAIGLDERLPPRRCAARKGLGADPEDGAHVGEALERVGGVEVVDPAEVRKLPVGPEAVVARQRQRRLAPPPRSPAEPRRPARARAGGPGCRRRACWRCGRAALLRGCTRSRARAPATRAGGRGGRDAPPAPARGWARRPSPGARPRAPRPRSRWRSRSASSANSGCCGSGLRSDSPSRRRPSSRFIRSSSRGIRARCSSAPGSWRPAGVA